MAVKVIKRDSYRVNAFDANIDLFKPVKKSGYIATKLAMRYEIVDNCFIWTGAKNNEGYGAITYWGSDNKKHVMNAHRAAYKVFVGEISDDKVLDHLCRNRSCINVDHLEPVTITENTLRGEGYGAKNKRKTHCPAGHEYTKENTYTPPPQPHNRKTFGGRECRICRYNKGVERRLRLKQGLNNGC